MLPNISVICVVRFDEEHKYQSFLVERTCGDWWHFYDHNGDHHVVSCPSGNSFPVRWCTTPTPLLPSSSCLSGQGVSWSLYRRGGTHSLVSSFFRFNCFGFFLIKTLFIVNEWKKCEWVAWQDHDSCRIPYNWNIFHYLERNWISPWCILPLMLNIFTSAQHITEFTKSSVLKCVYSPIHFVWLKIYIYI